MRRRIIAALTLVACGTAAAAPAFAAAAETAPAGQAPAAAAAQTAPARRPAPRAPGPAVTAPAVAQTPPRMPAADYYAIVHLFAQYAHGFDSGAGAGAMWADVFSPEGVFLDGSGRGRRGGGPIARFGSGGPNSRKGPTSVAHFVTNVVVEPAAAGATARSVVMIGGGGGRGRGAGPGATPGAAPAAAPAAPARPFFATGGQYWDDLEKGADGWHIRQRSLLRPGVTPATLQTTEYVDTDATAPARSATAMPAPITTDDYAQILQLEAREPDITVNVLVRPVPGGAILKAYRMRVDEADGKGSIGPGGMVFRSLVKRAGRWQVTDTQFVETGATAPAAVQPYLAAAPSLVNTTARAQSRGVGRATGVPGAAADAAAWRPVPADTYAEIRQLYARAALAYDSGADEGQAYASLFTPRAVVHDEDGRFISGAPDLGRVAKGETPKTPTDTAHYVYNVQVETTPEGARGSAILVVATLPGMGQPAVVTAIGRYDDTLVRTPEGWRFASRTYTPGLGSGRPSAGAAAAAASGPAAGSASR